MTRDQPDRPALFGSAMGSVMEEFFGITGIAASVLAALLVGAIAAGAAWLMLTRTEAAPNAKPVARFLFQDPRAAVLWLPVRLFVGW